MALKARPDAASAPAPAPATPPVHAMAAGAVADAPLPVVETGIPAITQMAGHFGWIDADTLALTTYSDPPAKVAWMVRRVVAFDVPRRSASTLAERGFVDCTDPAHALVSLEIGDLESRFGVGARSAPPVPRFDVWDPATHVLAPAPAGAFAGLAPARLREGHAPEDLAISDLSLDTKPMRYLEPEHGGIHCPGASARTWPSRGQTDRWRGAEAARAVLPLSINDISHEVRWLPFAKSYQLSAGTRETPLITMDLDGRVTRASAPPCRARRRRSTPTAPPGRGKLIRNAAADAALVRAGRARPAAAAACTSCRASAAAASGAPPIASAPGQAAGDDACTMSQPPQIAPDGCSVAFDAKPAALRVRPLRRRSDLQGDRALRGCAEGEGPAALVGTLTRRMPGSGLRPDPGIHSGRRNS